MLSSVLGVLIQEKQGNNFVAAKHIAAPLTLSKPDLFSGFSLHGTLMSPVTRTKGKRWAQNPQRLLQKLCTSCKSFLPHSSFASLSLGCSHAESSSSFVKALHNDLDSIVALRIVMHVPTGPFCRKVAPRVSSSPWLLCCSHTAASVGQNHFVPPLVHLPPPIQQWHYSSDSEGFTQPTGWDLCRGSTADPANTGPTVYWKCAVGEATSQTKIQWQIWAHHKLQPPWKQLLSLDFQLKSSELEEQHHRGFIHSSFSWWMFVWNGNNHAHWTHSLKVSVSSVPCFLQAWHKFNYFCLGGMCRELGGH